MSKKKSAAGKYAKKSPLPKILILILVLALVCVALLLRPDDRNQKTPGIAASTPAAAETVAASTAEAPVGTNLGYGLYVTDIGPYTGMYMEDGSDEILSNILMLVVKNDGDQDIQYARITLPLEIQDAEFAVTTLPVGESMVILEQKRMEYDKAVDYSALLPVVENIAYFQEPITNHEDKLKIQIIDGALNVTNISAEDISADIRIHYKNAAQDLLYGGITYQVTIEGGLKAGEIRQIMTHHASDTGSRIMFTSILQE